jgi:glycosyltransferase involved in cell wall biosynthesis
MNILHTETLEKWGGQQNRVLREAVGLRQKGHKVIVACNTGSELARRAAAEELKVYELSLIKQAYLKTVPQLLRVIRNEQIDIVSTHSSVDSWAGGIAAKIAGRKLVRFRHNLFPIGRDPLTRLIYALPDRIVAISDTIGDILLQYGIRQENIAVIRSSVDISRFNPDTGDLRDELGIPREVIVIGNTSTFAKVKGQETLFRAFNRICAEMPCRLLFAGSANEETKQKYLSLLDPAFRNMVIFLGHRDDIPEVLKTVDVFVYPSTLEGLGTALLEAMAMRRPVVVSDIPTFRTFIQEGYNGSFFRSGDALDLAQRVAALTRDAELRKRLGDRARETIIRKFSHEVMIDKTEDLYRSLLDGGHR